MTDHDDVLVLEVRKEQHGALSLRQKQKKITPS